MRKHSLYLIIIVILTFGFFSGFYTNIIEDKTTYQFQDNNVKTSSDIWSHITVISDNVNITIAPSIVNDSHDNLHIVWQDMTDLEGCGTDYDIFYANYSSATGKWSNTTVISDNKNGTIGWNTGHSQAPSIAIDSSNNLHVVWQDFTNLEGCSPLGAEQDIFYANYSTTTGKWSHASVISDNVNGTKNWNNRYSGAPDIAVDGSDNLHVVWEDTTNLEGCGDNEYDIFYANYSKTTGKWSNTTVISDNLNGMIDWNTGDSQAPSIAIDSSNNLHVVWHDTTDLEGCDVDLDIFYTNYSKTTDKWSNTTVISDNLNGTNNWNYGHSYDSSIAVDGSDNLHVVWQDMTDLKGCGTDDDIFYTNYSTTIGKWSHASVISDNVNGTKDWNNGISGAPDIAVDGSDNLHVAWADMTDLEGCGTDYDIFYANYSTTIGKWSHASVISDNVNGTKDWNNGISDAPSIAVDGSDNLHVAWADMTDLEGCDVDYDIFYAKGSPLENSVDNNNDDDKKNEDLDPLIPIAVILIALITTSFAIYLFKKRSSIKNSPDLEGNKNLNMFNNEIVEDDILISKMKHFCLIHKGPIEGYTYICDCGSYYCLKCLDAIKENENACWSCGKVIDPTKPVKKIEEVEDIDALEDEGVRNGYKPANKKSHKN